MPNLRLKSTFIENRLKTYLVFQCHYLRSKYIFYFPQIKNVKEDVIKMKDYMELLSQISLIPTIFSLLYV